MRKRIEIGPATKEWDDLGYDVTYKPLRLADGTSANAMIYDVTDLLDQCLNIYVRHIGSNEWANADIPSGYPIAAISMHITETRNEPK